MNIYAIIDVKAQTLAHSFFAHNNVQAIRSFSEAVNTHQKEGNNLANYPEDFDLYYVGKIDDNTGEITDSEKNHLANGTAVKKGA